MNTRAESKAKRLFLKLACQNLLRKPTRTMLLIAAVAMVTGAVFASTIVGRGVQASMERSFAKMGADLIVVPAQALVNITSALLTVQPTEATLDTTLAEKIKAIPGVEKVATQTIYQIPMMVHMPEHKANLIAFAPESDFTILPWLKDKPDRPLRKGDLISGSRREETLGEELEPCGRAAKIYGKLGISGVGPLDDNLFASYETAQYLAEGTVEGKQAIANFDPKRCSAILVKLSTGTTPEQVRFAVSQLNDVKVVMGTNIVTSTRQTTSALLLGLLGLALMLLLGASIVLSLLFSAIISERKREIGLLSAIGSRRSNIIGMFLAEACLTTGLGAIGGIVLGGALIMVFQRSLIYYLETLQIEFYWFSAAEIAQIALLCMGLTILCGLLGALVPAWKVSREEAYSLIQSEGG